MAGFTAIKSEVVARLGNRSDIDARAETWINDAYFELLLSPRFGFFELETTATLMTVASTRAYSLAAVTDLWFILSVRDTTNSRRLDRWDAREFDALVQTTATGQFPSRYARYGNTLELDPTPGGAYTITLRYRKRPSELSAGTSHVLGREWDEVLTTLAVVKGWEALEQVEQAAGQRQLVEGMLGQREEVLRLEDADAEYGIEVGMR